MKLVSVEEMRRIEQATDAGGHSYAAMMDMAGHAVANMVNTLVLFNPERAILILVGPGNNGGDGLVAGRYLREEEHQITVYVWKRNVKGDENFRWLKRQRRGVAILFADNDPDYANLREELRHADVVVDALLGTGATLPIEGPLANILEIARGEISVRRAAFQEPAPQPMPGAPRFPVMDALTPPRHSPRPTSTTTMKTMLTSMTSTSSIPTSIPTSTTRRRTTTISHSGERRTRRTTGWLSPVCLPGCNHLSWP